MQLTNGNLYWQKKSKIQKTYPYLTNDTKCDVLVIGGGINGAITAYFLAQEGANVIVAEKNIIGYSMTSASPAILDSSLSSDICRFEKMYGKNNTVRLVKLCSNALDMIEKIDKKFKKNTGISRQDSLYFTNKFMQKSNMSKEFELKKDIGMNTFFLDSHHTLNLNSGVLSKDGSIVIDPYSFTQGLFDYLSKQENVRIFENTEITSVYPTTDNVVLKTNNNFKIVADNVIFSSDIDSLKYIKTAPVELYKSFTIVTKPLSFLDNVDTNFVARDTAIPSHCLRFDNDNRIIFEGESVRLSDKMADLRYLSNLSNDKYRKLANSLNKMLSIDTDMQIEYTYNTTYATTKDNLPIIDEIPNMPNCFCNLSFCSNGILYAAIGADMLRNAIKGLYTKDMGMFKIDR